MFLQHNEAPTTHLLSHTTLAVHARAPVPNYDSIQDMGIMLNPDAPASNYSRGLSGVDQQGNYLVSNISVATFLLFLLCILIYRGIHVGQKNLRHIVAMGGDSDQRFWMQNGSQVWAQLKKNLFYAPLGKLRHNNELQLSSAVTIGTLPGRFHALLLAVYLISNVIFCLTLDWRADSITLMAELRGRTGQLGALNLIPTVLFALRNNPLIWLTGISYDDFNLFHRWCARLAVLESTLHVICWAVNNIRSGGDDQVDVGLASSTSFQWGMVAICAFGIILVSTLSPIRHAFYETFLASHRFLVLLALIGVYVHLARANLPQLPYIQLVFIFWGFELGWRYGKICYLNLSRQTGVTKITVEALPAEACRVSFDLRRPWKYTPGCHVHAYLPTIAWWSSHPFSVAWAEKSTLAGLKEGAEKDQLGTKLDLLGEARRGTTMLPRKSMLTVEPLSIQATKAWSPEDALVDRVSLICRARSGFTRQMYEKALQAPSKKFSTWGFLEGPYGGHETFASYGTVVLFAGGVGITHCAGFVHHLIQLYQTGQCATQKILLVWSIPNCECLEWVRIWMDQILKMEGRREILRVKLFVTKPRQQGEIISSTGSVQMFPGRCNPTTILQKEMEQRIGAMAVTVCGPGAFADSVRAATRDVVTEGCVDFIEEAFTY